MTEGTRTMRTLNITPLTPAQRAINELVTGGTEFSLTEKAIYNRVTENASDVRALAATVAELERKVERLIGLDKNTNERLAALESPETLQPFTVRVTPENELISPGSAEAAPEPVCAQTCPVCDGQGRMEARYPNGDGAAWFKDCMDCDGTGLVSFEQAVQEPPALDPVVSKIVDLYLTILPERNPGPSMQVEIGLRDEFYRRTGIGPMWEVTDAAIRAYGADAREGDK